MKKITGEEISNEKFNAITNPNAFINFCEKNNSEILENGNTIIHSKYCIIDGKECSEYEYKDNLCGTEIKEVEKKDKNNKKDEIKDNFDMLGINCNMVNNGEIIKEVKLENSDYNAYVIEKENGNKTIYYNGWESIEYKNIDESKLFLTKEGTIIFKAVDNNGQTILIKGKEKILPYNDSYSFAFIYNNGKLLYSYKNENNLYNVIYDGKIVGEDLEFSGRLKLSPKGDHYAFIGSEKNENTFIIEDGVKSKEYEEISYLTYSKDGKYFAYHVINNGKEFIVLNGKELKKYKRITDFIFGVDSDDLIYSVIDDDNLTHILKNGKEILSLNDIKYVGDIFIKNNKILITAKKNNGKDILIKDGKIILEADTIFTHDNLQGGEKNYYFIVENDGEKFIFLNDKKIKVDNEKYYLRNFIYGEKKYVYVLEEKTTGKKYIYGKEGRIYDGYEYIYSLFLNKNDDLFFIDYNGKDFYVAKNGKEEEIKNIGIFSLKNNEKDGYTFIKYINKKEYLYSCK